MKVVDLLESRRENWRHLDQLCSQMENRRKKNIGAYNISRFAALYRSACADLALAESYQLPPGTVGYLHKLVARSHNQLYRAKRFDFPRWKDELFHGVPQRLFNDRYLWLAFAIFWGSFLTAMYLAAEIKLPGQGPPVPGFAEKVLPEGVRAKMDGNFNEKLGSNANSSTRMMGFYIWHNTGIGLKCFAAGLIFGIGGLFETLFNGVYLGAMFGYMLNKDTYFFHFVTAHGPFELTAIVLSAAAGMRLGFALILTHGYPRTTSLRLAGREAMPTMGMAMLLFAMAAMIEGFISPSALPYPIKAFVAVLSSGLLVFYFVLLGWPRQEESEDDESEYKPSSPWDEEFATTPKPAAG